MAKLTKKQEKIFDTLMSLFHELIKVKHENNKSNFENIITEIKKEVNRYDS